MDNVSVFTAMDRAVLRLDNTDIFIPYAQIFIIAQNIRLACKRAKSLIHESERWNVIAQDENLEVLDYSKTVPLIQIKGKFDWKINMDSERIYMYFGDLIKELHFSEALKLSQLMRTAGHKAKAWAGDTNRHRNGMGILTDAEENYRLGL